MPEIGYEPPPEWGRLRRGIDYVWAWCQGIGEAVGILLPVALGILYWVWLLGGAG